MSVTRVNIEFKRIQTYLFAVPRLRTILGANALVGEVLRLRLPELAVRCGCRWPDALKQPEQWCRASGGAAQLEAPLAGVQSAWLTDAPRAAYEAGVLARDGGHFQALFPEIGDAQTFVREAAALVDSALPGLLVEIRMEAWRPDPGDLRLVKGWKSVQAERPDRAAAECSVFETRVCELSGQGQATEMLELREGRSVKSVHVSRQTAQQWEAGRRFREQRTDDVVGLMQRLRDSSGAPLLPCLGSGWKDASDLQALAGGEGRYLALLHADGNGVGSRAPTRAVLEAPRIEGESATGALQRWVELEAKVESFYASMRQSVRVALVEALRQVFGGLQPPGVRPYELLMVGGDDVLIACRAEYALPLVRAYAEALRRLPLADGEPLDIGLGVAIARPTYPFVALHAKCEELAASAKRLARGLDGAQRRRSVVDWAVITASTAESLAQHRRRHDLLRYSVRVGGQECVESLALSAKPYFVLPSEQDADPAGGGKPLAALLDAAQALRAKPTLAARSQLKSLPSGLRAGRRAGLRAFEALPKPLATLLAELEFDTAWQSLPPTDAEAPAQGRPRHGRWMTELVDLVEVYEIGQLGRGRRLLPTDAGAVVAAGNEP